MNTIILSSLLCLVFSALGVLGSAVTFSAGLSHVTGASASGEGEGLQSSLGDEDEEELELDEDLSGGTPTDGSPQVLRHGKEQQEKGRSQKGKGNKGKRKRKRKSKNTTASNPEHTSSGHMSSGHTQQTSGRVTEDPCSSSHKGYCIHGHCKYMADLREPVCMCNKGYDGERCGILLLPTRNKEESSRAEVVQTVLVVIAVVLSSISCLAILLMACTHYRTHKNFLAAYLGSGSEKQQLQKTTPCDITV
ncbi:proheparin-binding EGF-like growth factor isoform X2 [Coregonus clupeaformis]|uniref:proheparin-binding EGF-like growth factor isoform X2 n=1 Tax=Coregonus clupeaformis TaxID=59861 RepID=UPI001BE0F32F|nr:proheparin-binding EGF-like growth factor isoform X2 [Coregonus clupeaformis]